MRSYLIDEIDPWDMEKIEDFLKKNAIKSPIEGIFWIKIPDHLLTETQLRHKDCSPYFCAIELGKGWLKLELLVRSSKKIKCQCMGYCNERQREFLISYVNNMIEELGIRT